MRVIWLSIWLTLTYLSSSLVIGDVLRHAVIAKTIGDRSYAAGHIEWAGGILISFMFVSSKPLFYSWRRLAKQKCLAFITGSLVWPLYLVFVGAFVLILPINWPAFAKLWQHSGIWLWVAVSSDPMNMLGRWIDESDFWQSHIETWRSYGSLDWIYSAYPPKTASDVAVGIVCIVGASLLAPLFYLIHS